MNTTYSDADWVPPPVIPIIESEVLEIPPGLPPLEEFIQDELEKLELAKLKELEEKVEEEEEPIEEKDETKAEVPFEVDDDQDEDEGAHSEDEFEMPAVEVKKPKVQPKKEVDAFGIETILMDLDTMKKEAAKGDEEDIYLRLMESTNNFLNNLIWNVVDICEYEDPDEFLRSRLDKEKLKNELDDKLFQLDVEQKIRMFLNRKTVEYFRRKKATRPLIDDNPDVIVNQIKKYRDALLMVNKYKGLQQTTHRLLNKKTGELRLQVAALEEKSALLTQKFVNTVKTALDAQNSDRMENVADLLTKKMINMQKEISEVRCILIQRQHTMAGLQEKAKKLDDLGNGLHMLDFEHLQTETQALGKKIEDRNNELSRLHARCNADIHTLAHVREKCHMMRSTIEDQKEDLEEQWDEKQRFREHLHSLKIQRSAIRGELKKIRFQSGILEFAELLDDYDITEDKVINLRAKINKIKNQQFANDVRIREMTQLLIQNRR